jgi:hypothetical protein
MLERMRVLEARLCAYEALGVPVVTLRLLDAQDGVDQLHDYLLQCIQMAMEASRRDPVMPPAPMRVT